MSPRYTTLISGGSQSRRHAEDARTAHPTVFMCIIMHMKSFGLFFLLNMMHSILMIIVKINSRIQSKIIDLLTAVSLVTPLKVNI